MSDREHELQFLGDDGLDDDAHDTAPLVGMSPHTPAAGAPSQSAAALPGPLAYLAGSNHPKVAVRACARPSLAAAAAAAAAGPASSPAAPALPLTPSRPPCSSSTGSSARRPSWCT